MWIKKLKHRNSAPEGSHLRESGGRSVHKEQARKDQARKNPARPVLWVCLAVAALMLTAFVVFGAGNSLIQTPPAPAPAPETTPALP